MLCAVGLTPYAEAGPEGRSDVGPPMRLGPPQSPSGPGSLTPPGSLNPPGQSPQFMPVPGNPAAPNPPIPSQPDGEAEQGEHADSWTESRGITVDRLAPPDPESAGAIGAEEQPLPASMWQGASVGMVLTLFPRIGVTTSPALQNLVFRLLASPATPPAGDAPAGAFVALRAERLTSVLGRAGAALTLLRSVPMAQQSEAAGQIAVDLAFLNADAGHACIMVEGRDRSWQETYWDQGMVTCEALGGRDSDARVGLDVLREDKFKDDGFSALVDVALTGAGATPVRPLENLPSPQPMALALLSKAHASVPKRVLDSTNLAVLRAVALGQGFPPEQRLAAAEKATIYGALPPSRLVEAYLAVPLTPVELQNPLNQSQSEGGDRGRAILFRAAKDAVQPGARAGFLLALIDKASRADLYLALVRAAEPMLLALQPDPSISDAAVEFARALYALDHPVEAGRWLALAPPDAAQSLLALAHIVDDKAAPAWGNGDLVAGLRSVTRDAGLTERRAVLAAQLLAADGTPAPASAVLSLLDARVNVPPNAAPGMLIGNEAEATHVGSTVLCVAVALGDQGALASGFTLAQAIAGLRSVGLQQDARHLAIDAAISAGL